MEGQWRSEIPEDMRKTMITEMYHELARISGEIDKQKVWGSAAKFELMLWSSSPDRNSYLMKMQRKILSLKKKQGAGDSNLMANTNNVVASNAMNPAVNGMASGLNMNMNVAMNAQFQQNNVVASQAMSNFQQKAQAQAQVQAHAQAQAQVQAQAQAQAQQQNAAALAASNGASVGVSTGFSAVTTGLNSTNAGPSTAVNISTPPQQQAQQWLQRIQVQFQAQQRQLMHTQNQETQQLRQQHMNQQQQLSQQQQQQGVAPDMRRQQLQTLQQQHQLARTRLQHLHKSKQQQLQRKQQQYLMQKQHQLQQQHQQQNSVAPTTATASANSVASTAMMAATQAGVAPSLLSLPNATTVPTSTPTVSTTQAAAALPAAQLGVKPEQLAAAHTQQAAMREMQRAQNAAQIHADNGLTCQLFNGATASTASSTPTSAAAATTTATTTDSSNQTYVERLKETKQKYWDDLVIVYREFERMVKQKPANQQQERINTFLVNLKRIIALLQQDPSKVTSNNKNDLDRVEAHIQKQVLPILERLKNKTRAATATAGNNCLAAAQQEQMKKTQEAQRLAQLQEQQKKMQEQQKAEAQRNVLEEQKKKLQLEAAASAAAVKKQEMLEQQRKQKQKQLQAQHAQQQAIMQQQQRQRMLAQQAQLKAQNQLCMTAAAPQQAKTTPETVGVTHSAIATAGDDLATTGTTNGTGVSPSSASLPAPIDIPVSLSPEEINTSSEMASLTPAQYRTFKLPEARKQQLTAQHAKLREQQQELIMQQSRAKTPSHQAKLAHQAQRLAQMTNKISQQLVQCKLAEEYEQSKSMGMATAVSQPTLSQSTATLASLDKATAIKPEIVAPGNGLATSASEMTAPATTPAVIEDEMAAVSAVAAIVPEMTAKKNDNFKSVLPDMTGLGASEKLLTAVAAYEKHKPDVLKRSALRFSRIAVTIGAKLNTSYVTS